MGKTWICFECTKKESNCRGRNRVIHFDLILSSLLHSIHAHMLPARTLGLSPHPKSGISPLCQEAVVARVWQPARVALAQDAVPVLRHLLRLLCAREKFRGRMAIVPPPAAFLHKKGHTSLNAPCHRLGPGRFEAAASAPPARTPRPGPGAGRRPGIRVGVSGQSISQGIVPTHQGH